MSSTEKLILDIKFFNNLTSGDQTFHNELIDVFIDSTKKQLSDIKNSINVKDGRYIWHSSLHTLKGSCLSIGALRLAHFILSNQNKEKDLPKDQKIAIYNEVEELLSKTIDEIEKLKID